MAEPIFNEDGIKLLDKLLESYSKLLVTQRVPFKSRILGFPVLFVNSREELFARKQMIEELLQYHKRGETMPDKDGTGPRARSPRPKGKKEGAQQGNC